MSFVFDPFGSFTLGPAALEARTKAENERKRRAAGAKASIQRAVAERAQHAQFQSQIEEEYGLNRIGLPSEAPVIVPALQRNPIIPGEKTKSSAPQGIAQLNQAAQTNTPQSKPFAPLRRFS